MAGLARVGDLVVGICCCHKKPKCRSSTGIISTGSGNVIVENKSAATIGDLVITNCGHTGIIVTGNSTILVNNKPAAYIGSTVVGCIKGTVVSGAGTVMF